VLARCAAGDRPTLLPPLVALGVPVAWRAAERTAVFAIAYDGERRTLEVEAAGSPWSAEDTAWAATALAGVGWVHVAPLLRSDFDATGLALLASGRRLSLDGQGLVRVVRDGRLELDPDYDPALLEHVTVLKLAEDEAEALGGGIDGEALRGLGVPEVVVTLGSRGSLVVTSRSARRIPTSALPPASVDPTGAGDAFAAAYLVARAGGTAPGTAARRASSVVGGLLSGRTG